MKPILSLAKRLRDIGINLYLRVEYSLEANYAYICHALSGGTTKTRLLRYPELNWQTAQLPPTARSDRLAIFVAYHPDRKAPQSNINYIQALAECGFRIAYFHNGQLRSDHRLELEPFCERIICRENIGQDFGAWKDAIIELETNDELTQLKWLLICNDSNFFISSKKQKFESELRAALELPDYDLIALNKNQELWAHYQSYFLCFNQTILRQQSFMSFWKQYKPISNRYHAISSGEIKLTQDVIRSARSKILYEPSRLYVALRECHPSQGEFYSLLPKSCLYLVAQALNRRDDSQPVSSLDLHRALTILELHNPSHAMALLFTKYCDSPFLKKDIVKYGCFSMPQITEILLSANISSDSKEWEDIIGTYTLHGTNVSYIRYRKKAYRQGINPSKGSRFRGHGKILADIGITDQDE